MTGAAPPSAPSRPRPGCTRRPCRKCCAWGILSRGEAATSVACSFRSPFGVGTFESRFSCGHCVVFAVLGNIEDTCFAHERCRVFALVWVSKRPHGKIAFVAATSKVHRLSGKIVSFRTMVCTASARERIFGSGFVR